MRFPAGGRQSQPDHAAGRGCRIGDIAIWPMFRAVIPLLLAETVVVFLLALVPQVSTLLPDLLYTRP
jgi:TRAP-type C4-dicarboxylate transport system permease large subunit